MHEEVLLGQLATFARRNPPGLYDVQIKDVGAKAIDPNADEVLIESVIVRVLSDGTYMLPSDDEIAKLVGGDG